MKNFRNSFSIKLISIATLWCFVFQIVFPVVNVKANNNAVDMGYSGQATSEMVNNFTGDLNYSIPLFEVEGFPMTLNYNSNIGMETQSSWVGLGWSLSPGSIQRSLRGVPDDFQQEKVSEKTLRKLNTSGTSKLGTGTKKVFKSNEEGNGYKISSVSPLSRIDYWNNSKTRLQRIQIFGLGNTVSSTLSKSDYFDTFSGYTKSTSITKSHTSTEGLFNLFSISPIRKYTQTTNSVTSSLSKNSRFGSFLNMSFNTTRNNGWSLIPFTSLDLGLNTLTTSIVSTGTGKSFSFNEKSSIPSIQKNKEINSTSIVNREKTSLRKYNQFEKDISTAIEYNSDSLVSGFIYQKNSDNIEIQRENEGKLTFDDGLLPIPQNTFDIFNLSSPFVSGVFRPRKEYQVLLGGNGNLLVSSNNSISNIEAAGKYTYTFGEKINIGQVFNPNSSSKNKIFKNTNAVQKVNFVGLNSISKVSSSHLEKIGGINNPSFIGDTVKVSTLNLPIFNFPVTTDLMVDYTNKLYTKTSKGQNSYKKSILPNDLSLQETNQNNSLKHYSNGEMQNFFGSDSITSNDLLLGNNSWTDNTKEARVLANKRVNHLGGFQLTTEDGAKIIYDIPVYNIENKEIEFRCGNNGFFPNFNSNQIEYEPDDYNYGYDNYYNEKTIGSYPSDFLLTKVIFPNYVDVTQNGPTDDDHGSFVKFNYSKVYGDYIWRIPFSPSENDPVAFYSQGVKSIDHDDLAYFSGGKKEVWYLQSMESKNLVVEFYLSDRKDGFSQKNYHGGIDQTKPLKKLDRIEIYNKAERKGNFSGAVPLKTIFFEYDYSLCSGNVSSINGLGKLTLKSISFSYNGGLKSTKSNYQFEYNTNTNYAYDAAKKDPWGNYKPIDATLDNSIFPFVNQNDTAIDNYASAWLLSKVNTPKGAEINIKYESDAYNYVQDKYAESFVPIISVENIPSQFDSANPKNDLYNALSKKLSSNSNSVSGQSPTTLLGNNYLIFKLPQNQPLSIDQERFTNENFLKNGEEITVKTEIDLTGKGNYETLTRRVKVSAGLISNGSMFSHGYLKIRRDINTMESDVFTTDNPLINWGLSNSRNYLSELHVDTKPQLEKFADINQIYLSKGVAQKIDLQRSFVCLTSTSHKKYGGGARVKEITVSDNWGYSNSNNSSHLYGRQYIYENNSVSTGVADNEPNLSWQENPHNKGISIAQEISGAPNVLSQIIRPLGYTYLAFPTVGYSKVIVKPIDYAKSKVSSVGKTEFSFYTGKDFPPTFDKTKLKYTEAVLYKNLSYSDVKGNKANSDIPVLENYGKSQGFLIKTNNMHGQPKSNVVYDGNGKLINGFWYDYHTNKNELNNEISFVSKSGEKSTSNAGLIVDFIIDQIVYSNKENYSSTTIVEYKDWRFIKKFFTNNVQNNSSTYQENSKQEYITNSTVKHIHQNGILKSVRVFSGSSNLKTSYKAFDETTCLPIFSTTTNEFNDTVYNCSYPAYWAYGELSPNFPQNNFYRKSLNISSGRVYATGIENDFDIGDHIYTESGQIGWVIAKSSGEIRLIDKDGNPLVNESATTISKIESGKKNFINYNIFSVSTLKNPLAGGGISFDSVITAEANEMKGVWNTTSNISNSCSSESFYNYDAGTSSQTNTNPFFSTSNFCSGSIDDTLNPFLMGIEGRWIPHQAYAFNGNRASVATGIANTDIREQGVLESFVPFWGYDATTKLMVPINNASHPNYSVNNQYQNWLKTNEIVEIDFNGNPIENLNIDNTKMASFYGYNDNYKDFPVALVKNAARSNAGFDGCEDYFYNTEDLDCYAEGHWNFKKGLDKFYNGNYLDSTTSHSGNYSIRVGYNGSHSMSRGKESLTTDPTITETGHYKTSSGHVIDDFSPTTGDYLFSCWVKQESATGNYNTTFNNARVIINQSSGGGILARDTLYPTGPIIENWQRINEKVEIQDDVDCIEIKLQNFGESNLVVNFDDLRIHPFNASMVSVNYHLDDNRIESILDENNYATFFKYDKEGDVVSVFKETPDGIYSIYESRSALVKK